MFTPVYCYAPPPLLRIVLYVFFVILRHILGLQHRLGCALLLTALSSQPSSPPSVCWQRAQRVTSELEQFYGG